MVPWITHPQTRNADPAEAKSDPLANVQTLAECLAEWQRQRFLTEAEVQHLPVESITKIKVPCTTQEESSAC